MPVQAEEIHTMESKKEALNLDDLGSISGGAKNVKNLSLLFTVSTAARQYT